MNKARSDWYLCLSSEHGGAPVVESRRLERGAAYQDAALLRLVTDRKTWVTEEGASSSREGVEEAGLYAPAAHAVLELPDSP